MPRLEKFLRRRNKPRLLESLKLGGTLTKLAEVRGPLTKLAVRSYYRAEMRSPVPSGLWRSKGCEDDPKIVAVRLGEGGTACLPRRKALSGCSVLRFPYFQA